MTRVVIRLNLEDYKMWRPIFDQLASARKEMGSQGGELLRSSQNPNEVFVLWHWESLEGARGFFEMPDWRDLMLAYGATEPPDVRIFDLVEALPV